MDGNGRWASARGLPRIEGHRKGAGSVQTMVDCAPVVGIGVLTLYAFSSDNWRRPPDEVVGLFRLLRETIRSHTARYAARGVRVEFIGRRDRLSPILCEAMAEAEAMTARGQNLLLRIAVDYSSRDAILAAASSVGVGRVATREEFSRLLTARKTDDPVPDVDLLIRTGGEQRLSDFLLWECAYAELHFTRRMWPEFGEGDLRAAVEDFRARDRRFGAAPSGAACVAGA